MTKADTSGVEADLDVLDEHGAVLLAVQGLRLGTGASENGHKDRVLAKRLLTIEWRQRELPEVEHADAGTWLLINTATADVVATSLTDALKSHGAHCTTMCWPPHADHTSNTEQLGNHLRAGGFTGVVILTGPKNGDADDQSPLLGRESVQHLVRITRELPEIPGELPRLYVVTRNAQTVVASDVANLEQAGLRGLMRVIGTEHPHLRATQIDVDDATDAEQLARQLLGGSEEDETAWRNGAWYTARLSPTPLRPEERQTTIANHERDGMRLQIRTPGDLETMELVACERVPPGPGQIEVAVSASSINFADVLVAFGRYPAFEGRLPQLGTDFAGVVTAVGPDVIDHKVGDHVGGVCADGCWGTFITCDARLAVTLPAGLTDEQAAAVTTAHATAWYGLHELARIKSGDKVLIHSATGGVGQAAIAIARAAGAEIFATAGSEQRRQLLRDMGIEHVYDSRSLEFADLIRRDTDGYGVDVVLNSVTGAAQRAGLELLALGGRFVEIGKRDIYGDTRLGLFPFRRNLAFYAVDLGLLSYSDPDRLRELLNTVYQRTADGTLPMPESTHYPLADAATAVRTMSGARHTGKLVLDVPHTGSSRVVVPPAHARVFSSDGAYIITGGLGGLGLFLAEKIAAAGCGRIVLSSRSQPTPEALETIERIRAIGADVVVECGDIAQPGTAQRLVATATATGLPVRGVLHAAAVVEDATLTNITDELIERDWAPKVYGAWNLHTATADQPLDWFCSFSSAAALVGSPGQGAYAAANSWLDAFTHVAPGSGTPRHRDRLGRLGPDRARHRPGRRRRRCYRSRRGRLRVRSAAAPRPRLHRLRADHGDTVVDDVRRAQPLRRSVPLHRAKRNGHKQTACRARRATPGRVAHPATASDLRSGQRDSASQRRSRPAALRVRPGLTGRPRTTYPHRDRNGDTHHVQRHLHHHHSRFGGAAVRKAGARGSRLTSRGGPMELDDRAFPLTRGQLDIWLAQETGRVRYGVAAWPLCQNRGPGPTWSP